MPLQEITWGHIASEGLLRISVRVDISGVTVLKNRYMFESKGTELSPTKTKQCGNRVVSTDLALYIKQLVNCRETLQLCSVEQTHI